MLDKYTYFYEGRKKLGRKKFHDLIHRYGKSIEKRKAEKCLICDEKSRLEYSHIKSKSEFKDYEKVSDCISIYNTCWLCPTCHEKLDHKQIPFSVVYGLNKQDIDKRQSM